MITREAEKLVVGDRNASYGNPREDYERVAKVWSGLLKDKLTADITPEEAIMCMIGLKLCREIHKPKEDTSVDIVGYTLCLDWATTGKKPEAELRPGPLVDFSSLPMSCAATDCNNLAQPHSSFCKKHQPIPQSEDGR